MFRLILVRHGITEWNQSDRRCGHSDVPLAAEGERQAEQVGGRLANEAIDAVWCSDLMRARRTAGAIADHHDLSPHVDPRLREIYHGAYEGLTTAEIDAACLDLPPDLRPHRRALDAEPLSSVWERIVAVRDAAERAFPDGTVVFAGHLGPLRMLLCHAVGIPLERRGRFRMENASVSILEYAGGAGRLALLNETSHLRV